jgi:hypothetical protein
VRTSHRGRHQHQKHSKHHNDFSHTALWQFLSAGGHHPAITIDICPALPEQSAPINYDIVVEVLCIVSHNRNTA